MMVMHVRTMATQAHTIAPDMLSDTSELGTTMLVCESTWVLGMVISRCIILSIWP